jgi:type II secretory pathway pseudopilin PulG
MTKRLDVSRNRPDAGFMMVALLVCMSIAAIWLAAALPSWRQQAQRAKEDDLIFRGEQYARAIVLYQNKNRNLPPPDIDTLISQHYLRKKWKDPVTGQDFVLVGPGIISQTSTTPGSTQPQPASQVNTGGSQQPGITGVRSASTATSIKVYNNQQQYNLWQFDAATYRTIHGMQSAAQAAGQQGGGRQGGQQGGRDTGPGGPGGRGGPGGQQVGPGRGGGPGGAPPVAGGGRGRGN